MMGSRAALALPELWARLLGSPDAGAKVRYGGIVVWAGNTNIQRVGAARRRAGTTQWQPYDDGLFGHSRGPLRALQLR